MNINFTGQSVEVTDALRNLATKKFDRIRNHFDHITNAHMIFNAQKLEHRIEITVHVPGREFAAQGSDKDMYKALDSALDKLDRQVRDYKEKFEAQRRRPAPVLEES